MIVIIPDIHGEVGWVRSIRDAHPDATEFVCLGDYVDGRSRTSSTVETVRFLHEWKETDSDRLTLLTGNHDLPYWEVYPQAKQRRKISPHDLRFPCSGFSRRTAETLAKVWDENFWKGLKMAVIREGWVLSHAGIHPEVFSPENTEDWIPAVEVFAEEADSALKNLHQTDSEHSVFAAGFARGGFAPVGGLVWLDFQVEFSDEQPFPQIVGHTRGIEPRQKGESWCLDSGQTSYGLLHEGGRLEIKTNESR